VLHTPEQRALILRTDRSYQYLHADLARDRAANAVVLPPQGQNMLDIYKSKWLREKEAAMAAYLEQQDGKRLLAGKEPQDE
jgi:hypothetical protein